MEEAAEIAGRTHISAVKRKAAILLSFLVVLSALGLTSAGFVGAESGELRELLVESVRKKGAEIAKAIGEALKEKPTSSSFEPEASTSSETVTTTTTRSEVKVEVNYNTGEGVASDQSYQVNWVYPSLNPDQDYQETSKAYDDWWAKTQEQNRDISEESKKVLERFRQDGLQKLESFKSQGQQGMEEFRKQMEVDQKKFLEEHGIIP